MGLLQKLSDSGLDNKKEIKPAVDKNVIHTKSNSVGLLKKSLYATGDNHRLDFFEFTNKYNLEIVSLLIKQDQSYKIKNSLGFDGESICLSASTADFWDGTIKTANQLYSYKAEDSQALPYFQFFSKKLKEKINSINIIKCSNDSIIFICNKEVDFTPDFIADLNSLQANAYDFNNQKDYQKTPEAKQILTIDYSEALESFVLSNSKNELYFSKVILGELFYSLKKNFTAPDKIEYSDNYCFTLYLNNFIPIELLYNHLKIENHFILDNHSELISITQSQNFTQAEQ